MKDRRLVKRVTATIISFILVLTLMIPGKSVQAETGNVSKDTTDAVQVTSGEALLETMKQSMAGSKPYGFDSDTLSPYGTEKGEAFNMLEKSELFLYYNSTSDKGTYKLDTVKSTTTTDYVYSAGHFGTVNTVSISDVPDLVFTKSVAFDPTGCGRKNHVAVIGFEGKSKQIQVYVINAETNKISAVFKDGDEGSASWLLDDGGKGKGIHYYESGNFIDITAGDYNHDGKDTIVVYSPLNGNAYHIMELEYNNSQIKEKAVLGREYIHNKYTSLQNGSTALMSEYNTRSRLGVSLATGDFDGDGVEDLAILSYLNRIDKKYASRDYTYYLPQLYVLQGAKQDSMAINKMTGYRQEVGKLNDAKSECVSMYAPSVAAGDIDFDGADEIVISGYKKVSYPGNSDKNKLMGIFNEAYEKKSEIAIYSLEVLETKNQLVQNIFTEIDSAAIGNEKLYSGDHNAWQQYTTECVAFGGTMQAEYMLLNGWLYTLNGSSLTKADFDYFNSRYKPFGNSSRENFISAVAIGNFDNNDYGQEQMFVALACKEDGADDYAFKIVEVYANSFTESSQKIRTISYNADKKDLLYNKGDNYDEHLNCILAAVDYDYDSVVARYTGKYFAYTDPSVVAVLQAAPYYDELDIEDGETTYAMTETYQLDREKFSDTSFSIGICAETKLGPVSTAMEAGCTVGFSESYINSRQTSETVTFTAGNSNQIVVRRTLVYIYTYDLLDKYGNWTDTSNKENCNKGMMVTVPQSPMYYQMSVDTYNSFARSYNSYAKAQNKTESNAHNQMQTLTELSDTILERVYLKNNEGNPFEYRSNWNDTEYQASQISKTGMSLSHSGGSSKIGYEVTSSETNSQSSSEGGYFGMSVMFGGGITPMSEAWAGASISFDTSVGSGMSVTTANTKTCEGAVTNVTSEDTDYGFNWSFGTWKMNFGVGGEDVLCMGYAVTNQTAPVKPVMDLSGSYVEQDDGAKVRLNFTEPVTGKRTAIVKYNVYKLKDGVETYVTSVNANKQGEQVECYVDVSQETDMQLYYVVKAVDGNDNESAASNEISCYLLKTGKSAYDIAVDNGFKGTVVEWLASLQGENGKNGVGITGIEKKYRTV